MKKLVVMASAAIASGCMTTPEQAAALPDLPLCSRAYSTLKGGIYGYSPDDTARAEIRRRNLLTDSEWALVDARQVQIGMSECALRASWGIPTTVNASAGSWGSSKQYVYRDRGYYTSTASYVYVRKGKVDSWQQ